jgi:hypothetical protein
VAVTTNAEPKRASFCIETSPSIFFRACRPHGILASFVLKSCRKLA